LDRSGGEDAPQLEQLAARLPPTGFEAGLLQRDADPPPHSCRLAGAVGPEESEDLSRRDGQVDIANRFDPRP
jgi:hypothetical protein